jgi:hypothetical protein
MRTSLVLVSLLLIAFCLSGCLYTHVRTPLDTDMDKTEMGDKQGEASIYGLLWLFAWGDSSTKAAADEGNLSVVTHLDQKLVSVLFGLYFKETTLAYGYGDHLPEGEEAAKEHDGEEHDGDGHE